MSNKNALHIYIL